MREIQFRGKRIDNGEWVEGGYYREDYTNYVYITFWNSFGLGFMDSCRVDPATVGQYTGLTDKNCKRIFDGDVVRIERAEWAFDGMTTEYRTEQGVIAYDDWGMIGLIVDKWEGHPVWSDFFHVCGLTDRIHDWSFEIIGNIHDNPELMKEEPK